MLLNHHSNVIGHIGEFTILAHPIHARAKKALPQHLSVSPFNLFIYDDLNCSEQQVT